MTDATLVKPWMLNQDDILHQHSYVRNVLYVHDIRDAFVANVYRMIQDLNDSDPKNFDRYRWFTWDGAVGYTASLISAMKECDDYLTATYPRYKLLDQRTIGML